MCEWVAPTRTPPTQTPTHTHTCLLHKCMRAKDRSLALPFLASASFLAPHSHGAPHSPRFTSMDQDESGEVDLEEFMDGVRGGDLNDAREACVQQAWEACLERVKGADKKSIPRAVPLQGLVNLFDCSWYPSVRGGKVRRRPLPSSPLSPATDAVDARPNEGPPPAP